MKCDVCQTTIPFGEDTCPNCGYKVRKEHAFAYDANHTSHEHIQRSKPKLKHTNKKDLLGKIVAIVSIVGIVFSIGSTFITIFMDNQSQSLEPEENMYVSYNDKTFSEMIDEGYDQNGRITSAKEYTMDLMGFLEKNQFIDIADHGYCTSYNDILTAHIEVEAKKDNHNYTLTASVNEQETICEKGIKIFYRSKESMRHKMLVSKDTVNLLADYMGLENIYNQLEDARKQLVRDGDSNRYVYSNYEEDSIYLSETVYSNDSKPYSDYLSITQNN